MARRQGKKVAKAVKKHLGHDIKESKESIQEDKSLLKKLSKFKGKK